MNSFRNTIKTQNRGDTVINYGNWKNLVDKVNALGNIVVGGDDYQLVRYTGSGRQFLGKKGITPSPSTELVDRFAMRERSSTSIDVLLGAWTRNGTRVTLDLSSGDGSTYETITGINGSSTTYYITLELLSAGSVRDPALIPSGNFQVTAETSLPTDADMRNSKFVIGTVVTNSSSVIDSITQWWLGDIDDIGAVSDADSLTADSDQTFSIQTKLSGAGVHELELELYQFRSPGACPTLDNANDTVLVRDDSGGALVYADPTEFADNWAGSAINTYLVSNGDFWIKGANYSENYGESIGDDGGNLVIDLDGKQLEDGGGNAVVDWGTRQLLTGDWTVKGTGSDLILEGTQASTSTATGALRVAGGGKFGAETRIDAGGGPYARFLVSGSYVGELTSGSGVTVLLIDSGKALSATDGTRTADLADGGSYAVSGGTSGGGAGNLGGGTYGVESTTGGINCVGSSSFFHGGTAGVTIANWLGGGIMTGTSVVERTFSQLKANDKLLVIPA